jgi:ectoine hydroxylase-related dioxygenase (phytanoyl-CoA dioxygenase family)
VSLSAWLALDPATTENGCVRVISGTHRSELPTNPASGDPVRDSVREDVVDESRAFDIELDAGEFFLFSERLLHGSTENRTADSRTGLTVRLIEPWVSVDHARLLDGMHRCILVRGSDGHGVNQLQGPPPGHEGPHGAQSY